jgi:hypothetical protein
LQLAKRYHRIGEEMARTIDRENLSWALFVSQIALSMSRSLRKDDLATSVAQYFEFDGAGSKLFSGARAKILGFLGFTRRLTDETLAEVRRRAKELVVARHRALSRMIPVLDSFMLLLRSEPQEKEVTEFTAELEQRASLKMRRATPFHKGLVALYQAARAEDSAERAQWILAGNCRLLFHDQTALQEDIEQIVASDVSVQVMDRLRRRTWFLLRPLFPLVGILAGPFLKRLSEYCKDILPRYALELSLAEGRRSPSLNGPPRNPSHEFPVHLQHIWNPKTEALLERFERPPENRASHDPKGWGDLNVRMAYLVDVLREEQQSLDLLELRLTDEEVHCLQTAEAQTE